MITSAAAPRPDPERLPARWLLAIWGAAFAVLVVGSWVPAWSGDEAATIMVVRRDLTDVLRTSPYDPALLPYYLFVNTWALSSSAAGWVRLSSVLAMSAAVAVIAALGSRLLGRLSGVVAAGLMLALPAVSRYAHDVRPYALSVLLAVAVAWCWSAGLDRWTRRLAYVASLATLGLVQPYGLLLVPALLAASALRPRADRRSELTVVGICSAVGLLAIAPHLLGVARRAIGQIDPPPLTLANLVEEVLRLPVALLTPSLAPICAGVVLALTAAGLVVAWRTPRAQRAAVVVASWLVVPPIALCVLQVLGGGPGLVARYWTSCLPAIALGAGSAIAGLWSLRRPLALGALGAVVALGLPTQWTIRTVDGHLGQRWRDLPAALDHPALAGAPLLVEGWSYRALVSNDPELARRMLLVVNPASEGRINPRTYGPGSPIFTRLLSEHGRVVVLQGEQGYADALPARRSFVDFRPELKSYPVLAVRCAYFGEPIGVFTTRQSALTLEEAQGVAEQIVSVAPRRVRCATGDV